MAARDFDVWDQKPPFELDPHDWDYGQGKTRLQEADDSMAMLAGVMLFALGFLITVGVALYVWVF